MQNQPMFNLTVENIMTLVSDEGAFPSNVFFSILPLIFLFSMMVCAGPRFYFVFLYSSKNKVYFCPM